MTAATGTHPVSIVFCSLGGTIQCEPQSGGGGVVPSLSPEHLLTGPFTMPDGIRVIGLPLGQMPSAAMSLTDLYRVIQSVGPLVDAGATGVVVTMGTDMLEEAAFALDLLWRRPEPLVVTAAMRAPGHPGADGPANLRAALLVAASPQARGLGCVVVMNDEVHAAWQVRKVHTSSPSAFQSAQSGPVGSLTEDRLRIMSAPVDLPAVSLVAAPQFPAVALLRASIGDDGRLLHSLVESGFAGVVVEAAGGGSVPPAWAQPLGLIANLVPTIYVSRTGGGVTLRDTYAGPGSERDLLARGLQPAGGLDGLKARVLLCLLLAADAPAHHIRAAFEAFDQPTHTGRRRFVPLADVSAVGHTGSGDPGHRRITHTPRVLIPPNEGPL